MFVYFLNKKSVEFCLFTDLITKMEILEALTESNNILGNDVESNQALSNQNVINEFGFDSNVVVDPNVDVVINNIVPVEDLLEEKDENFINYYIQIQIFRRNYLKINQSLKGKKTF
jgi:hypothetical protein